MNVNTSKERSFYTQGQRFAAKVLLVVWLLISCSPGYALAVSKHQRAIGPAKVPLWVFVVALLFGRDNSFKLLDQPQDQEHLGGQESQLSTGASGRPQEDVLGLIPQHEMTLPKLQKHPNPQNCEQFFIEQDAKNFWKVVKSGRAELSFDFNTIPSDARKELIHTYDKLSQIATQIRENSKQMYSKVYQAREASKQVYESLTEARDELKQMDGKLVSAIIFCLRKRPVAKLTITYGHFTSLDYVPKKEPGSMPKNFSAILSGIGSLTNLEVLDLSNNKLQSVSYSPGDLPNLRQVDLSYNRLLPDSLGDWLLRVNLPQNMSLNLTNNRLGWLPGGLVDLEPNIDLTGNPICCLPDEFQRLVSKDKVEMRDRTESDIKSLVKHCKAIERHRWATCPL